MEASMTSPEEPVHQRLWGCMVQSAVGIRTCALCARLRRERQDAADQPKAFFRSAKAVTGVTPARVTTDGHDSYPRAIRSKLDADVKHRTNQYLNNRIEQDHRGIKGRYGPMRGFKVTSPHRDFADVSTNSATTCKPVHAVAEPFRPTPAAIVF